ncbi:hypothetical protein BV372_06385 [Nostoc sp. T09]|uniref:hypothetical protein n=1 Tax=Nostoc sp. T09 TaxID=1932621 RepID=UPI000A373CFC|nr:hypothetical protein [Nostoc sp. T09]OUL36589.1 hypothetical protein BV372_06385 [Nostoc sp. T09]
MSFQRVHQSNSENTQTSRSTSQFTPRPFSVQQPEHPLTQAKIENQAFEQTQFEATGLRLKEKYGTITPVEQEKLGVLQAKMDSFWAQQMEMAKAQPNLLEILIRNAQSTSATSPAAIIQPKLTLGQPNNLYEQQAERVADPPIPIPSDQQEIRVYFAGITQPKAPPAGMSFISQQSSQSSLGTVLGWTGIPNAPAYTAPRLDVKESHVRKPNNTVMHYAEILPTTSKDAVIESYYPAPGDHARGTYTDKGKTYISIWRISKVISKLVQDGEQEHVDDAQRAYDITYKLIADQINLLAAKGEKFGPATTPDKARQMAEAELFKLLPAPLQTGYGGWVAMLDFLLKMTNARDVKGWHTLDSSASTQGNKTIYTIVKTGTTQITTVPSDKLVNYPSDKF